MGILLTREVAGLGGKLLDGDLGDLVHISDGTLANVAGGGGRGDSGESGDDGGELHVDGWKWLIAKTAFVSV